MIETVHSAPWFHCPNEDVLNDRPSSALDLPYPVKWRLKARQWTGGYKNTALFHARTLLVLPSRAVGWPLVSVHVTGTESVVRGGEIRLVCKARGSNYSAGRGQPRSVLWVKDGRRLSSEVGLKQYSSVFKVFLF